MSEVIKSYAKVNVGLLVKEKRSDGFHNIDSYFALIDLYDEIDIAIAPSSETIVNINRDISYLDKGRDIMEKAALAFSNATGKTFSLDIEIKKNIPSKAGLGGGSSNGAEILKFLNSNFNSPLNKDELIKTALTVGSDLPFFISGLKTARIKGRGEVIKKCEELKGDIDLFFPPFSQDTKDAYRILDEKERDNTALPDSLKEINYKNFPNDFELVVKRSKEIEEISKHYSYFSLSGSGSTYFGINAINSFDLKESKIKQYKTRFL